MNALISYQFETEPVRVLMRDGNPWFPAVDICRVLDIRNARDALEKLDDDEKGVALTDTLGGRQELNIVSESGMYALVFKSRKPEARRFRRWVTSEVLPSIRKTGKYELPAPQPAPLLLTIDTPTLNAYVGILREARRLHGPATARLLWARMGLPVAAEAGDPMALAIAEHLAERDETTVKEAMDAAGARPGSYERVCSIMRGMGWEPHRVPGYTASTRQGHTVWRAPGAGDAA